MTPPNAHAFDPHTLVRLEIVLADNGLEPLAFFKAYLEDRAPPVIVFEQGLYLARSDLHSWKRRLRAASFARKAEALGIRVSHG